MGHRSCMRQPQQPAPLTSLGGGHSETMPAFQPPTAREAGPEQSMSWTPGRGRCVELRGLSLLKHPGVTC